MSVNARWETKALIRSHCGLLSAVWSWHFNWVRAQAGVRWQRPLGLICAFVLIAALSIEVRADQPPARGEAVVLMPDITKWSPELKGGLWAWQLTKYGALDWFFRIGEKTLLMLSTDINVTDNVLWDPLTGTGLHMNREEYKKFVELHRNKRYTSMPNIYADQLFPLDSERVIQTQLSPPYLAATCNMLFSYYISIYEKGGNMIRSFYVISKLREPIAVMRDTCAEGDNGPNSYTANFKYNTQISTFYSALQDNSVLFVVCDGVTTRIIRLDQDLTQHSTVDGHIFILDAAPINAELEASPRIKDSRFRYEVILRKIDAQKADGL